MEQLPANALVGERYRVVGPLGAGGMGVVYRARDEKLGRLVALKTLPKDRIGDSKARARLVREARSAAALEHPGIAQVFDVGETEDGGAFLVMELVRGESLRARMEDDALDRDALLECLGQVADALDHAHANGVVHRDIKPDNIMVREDGRAVLVDFGLAKDFGPAVADTVGPDTPTEDANLTKEGTLIGTLSYLAPEQARGRDVGPRSDQFALATSAYEALTGVLPWDGPNAAAILAQILVDDAPPPSSLESSLPIEVDQVFAKALSKDAADRFEDAASFVRALREAFDRSEAGDAPIDPLAMTPSVTPPETGSGLPWGWMAGGVLVLLAGALAGSLLWSDPPPPEPEGLPDDPTLACPVLEASGVEAPTGWLGAMAADLVCARLGWRLGGDPARTRGPAALAGLPIVAGDDFPEDPWGAEDARATTLEAARQADAYVDGEVSRDEDGTMHVSLRVLRGGEALASGEGEGQALYAAVAQAIDALADGLPFREQLDPVVATWTGTESAAVMWLADELFDASLTGVGVEARCEALIARRAELGPIEGEIGRICTQWRVDGADALTPPSLDRSSPARLALTAPENADALSPEALREIAETLGAARRDETHPIARATLARGEIQLWELLDEMDRARDLLLTAVEDLPRDWWLRVHFVRAMLRTPGAVAATRALAAWHPGSPEAWRTLALPVLGDPERALPLLRRAYQSGGMLPLHGTLLADQLLREGRREEVRRMAARYATAGPMSRLAGEYLRARVEISEARFGRAYERLGEALSHDQLTFGRLINGDHDALVWLLELAALLEREHETADPLVRAWVLGDVHRLHTDQPHYELPAIALCMHATPELARPCLAKLRSLREGRTARAGRLDGAAAFLAGAERYVEEDWQGAVDAWRPMVRSRSPFLPAAPFREVGETEIARRLERSALRRGDFAGAHPVHALRAQRAADEGDAARARELAERVLRAWASADVEVPAVTRMRALLASP
ncbi:MAG: serine/threonine-protein kinase [Sandaracinaceae bacterium]